MIPTILIQNSPLRFLLKTFYKSLLYEFTLEMILLFAIFWLSIKQVSVWYNVFVFKQHETIKNVRVTSRKLHFELFMLLLIFSLHDIPCCICGIPWTCKRFLFERNQKRNYHIRFILISSLSLSLSLSLWLSFFSDINLPL